MRLEGAMATARRHPGRVAGVATALALVGLLLPLGEQIQLGPVTHVAHVLIFAVLVVLWMQALTSGWLSTPHAMILCLIAGSALAIGTEVLQYWIPGRWPGMGDLMRNLLGLAAGLCLFLWLGAAGPRR